MAIDLRARRVAKRELDDQRASALPSVGAVRVGETRRQIDIDLLACRHVADERDTGRLGVYRHELESSVVA